MSNNIDIRKIKQKPKAASVENATDDGTSGFWEFLNKDIRFGADGLPERVKESFYLELYTLLDAGVDIRTALELIRNEQKKKKIKAVFDQVIQQVVKGASISEALQKSKQFSSYEYFSVRIGEETGKLIIVLKELAEYYQKKIRQKRQIMGAITYPVVVLVVAIGAVGFMITYVVPMFSDVFKRFGSDLPAVTKGVIVVSGIFNKYFSSLMFLLISAVIIGYNQRKKPWFRKYFSALILKMPVVGPIVQKIYLSQLSNTMALLVGSRIPIVQAIQLTRQMITFYPVENSLQSVEEKIIGGASLYKSMSEHPVYPAKMISMIKVGEEVNQLELFFTRISEQFNNEVEHQTTMLSKFLEPLIIIVLGLVVGVILIAMYLPLFKLGQGF